MLGGEGVMKNIKRIAIFLIIILFCVNTYAFAIDNPEIYNPGPYVQDPTTVGNITGNILGYVRTFGIILSVVILTIIGLKYIFSSLDEKASYKENAVPYVVGVFLLASATIIPSIIWDLAH